MDWQPIETAPKGMWLLGLRANQAGNPVFVGTLYDVLPGCLIDRWAGRWVRCTHWKPTGIPETSA